MLVEKIGGNHCLLTCLIEILVRTTLIGKLFQIISGLKLIGF